MKEMEYTGNPDFILCCPEAPPSASQQQHEL